MLSRKAITLVRELGQQFPAVLILGPRQCGKTTLVRHFMEGEYFDLERPSDQQVFTGDIEFALSRFQPPLIIDEAQTLPGIFPVIRSLIDLNREIVGSYFLLGSVNPALVKHISESLAGRVGIVELTPFLLSEIGELKSDFQDLWIKGGFPDAVKESGSVKWQRWQENYLRTFIERDIPRFGIKLSPLQIRRLMGMLAHQHGGLFNASDLGRSLGVSYHTVQSYLDLIEGHFLIRRLPPFVPNLKKRIVKSPKIYIRDSGILHYLHGISNERRLLESPMRGNSFEGFMIEQLIAREQLAEVGSRFYFYRTHSGAEIDLIVDRGAERIGFEFKCSASIGKRDWMNLKAGIRDGIIHRGCVVYMGERDFQLSKQIQAAQAERLLLKE